MNMDDYSGPSVAVLVRIGDLGARTVDSAYPDEDEAAHALGKDLLAGTVTSGTGWEVVMVPAPLLVRRDAGQPEQHEPESVGDLDAIAATISFARTGRPWHEVRTTPGGVGDLEAARKVLAVVGQRMADTRSIARQDADEADRSRRATLSRALGVPLVEGMPAAWQVLAERLRALQARTGGVEQREADLAAALDVAIGEVSWSAMCRKVRGLRQAADDAVGVVAGLRGALAPAYGTASADAAPTALVGMVASLVDTVTRLVGDDPARVQPDAESLDRALRAHWEAYRVTGAWDRAPEHDRERERSAVERIIRAYLADPEDG